MPAVLFVVSLVASILSQSPASCPDVAACRQAAVEAAERKDYEQFHDLAWRAVQRGRPNDPELMLLVARAQSASGRPGDALVMLRRLAGVGGVTVDVTHEDFGRVRALDGWADVEAALVAANEKHAASATTAADSARPAAKSKVTPRRRRSRSRRRARAKPEAVVPDPATTPPPAAAGPPPSSGADNALLLTSRSIDPIGLAYDNVSRRFVLGDRRLNKLIVADEIFKRVNDLIGAGAGGFGTLTALEIDRRRGDLWVTSDGGGGASLHKLQLVSGRVLKRLDVPADWRPVSLQDISISDDGTLLLLDTAGGRLLAVDAAGQRFTRSMELEVPSPFAIAAHDHVVYVAHADGVSAADTRSRKVTALRPSKGVALTGLRRIRWHGGTLIALQDDGSGAARLVRIRINGGGTVATSIDRLDDSSAEAGSATDHRRQHRLLRRRRRGRPGNQAGAAALTQGRDAQLSRKATIGSIRVARRAGT